MRVASASLLGLLVWSRAHAVDIGTYAQDLGGGPTPVGAGPRALGMGGAFTAIADDATANTWNPGGMVQLERPEVGLSFAYRHDQVDESSGSSDHASRLDVDHLSLVLPFFAGGFQQTLGLAWQRQFDFTRSLRLAQQTTSVGSNTTLTTDDVITIDQDGGFASVSASYAIELIPGLGVGATASAWGDDWTLASRYHRRQRERSLTTLDIVFPPISLVNLDEIESDRTTTVKEGYSFVFGAWWQATQALTVAVTVKPRYRLRLTTDGVEHVTSTDIASGTVTTDSTTPQQSSSKFTYPTTATLGFAWRMQDVHTVALDAAWTRWRDYRIDQDGASHSPVNGFIDPSRFPDTYSLRLGYEHLSILSQAVLVERIGGSYEGLPGATRVADPADADTARPKIDDFFAATAGLSLCLRNIIFDASAQLRMGNDVGAGQYAAPDRSADTRTVTVVGGVTYQF